MQRPAVVVDTNVAVTANGKSGDLCTAKCAKRLNTVTKTELLVIDRGDEIFKEYQRHLSFAGKPGAGDYFFKWLVDNRYRPHRVAIVDLTMEGARSGCSGFPDDPELAGFDLSDRKFVAASRCHHQKPPILNATDSDWWHFRDALQNQGVRVEFVCGEQRFEGA